MVETKNLPTKPGLYWAKNSTNINDPYDLVVHVYGESPFMKMKYWNLSNHCVHKVRTSMLITFGGEIIPPKKI